MSDTRWSARADALKAFHSGYSEIVVVIDGIAGDQTKKAECRQEARGLVATMHGPTGNWRANCSVESGAPAISTVQCQSAVSGSRFEHDMRHLPVADRVCAEATTDVCRR